jgi:hypothetical protein
VLAHELAHVRQQTGGAVSMLPQRELALEIDPDPELEREAEETAERVMKGGELGIERLQNTDVHVQRIPEEKIFDAMAIFEAETNDETISEFRQGQSARRLDFLHGTAKDVLDKQDKQKELELKRELEQSDSVQLSELAKRTSEADISSEIDELTESVTDDLSDVATTEDQRATLRGDVVTDEWDDVGWTSIKTILSATTLGATVAVSEILSKVAGIKPDEIGEQAVARLRRGEISLDDLKESSWEDLKESAWGVAKSIWNRTNGSLQDRAEQIKEEVRHDEYEPLDIEGASESGAVYE